MSESKEGTAPEVAEKWHPGHSDPNGDIVLASTDGVLFRSYKWRLGQASPVFKAMLEVGSPSTFESHEIDAILPVSIDASSDTVSHFLDLLHSYVPTVRKEISFATAKELLDLCEKYECDRANREIIQHLYQLASSFPWELLQLASDRNDVKMGQEAVAAFSDETFLNLEYYYHSKKNQGFKHVFPWNKMDRLSHRFYKGLVRYALQDLENNHFKTRSEWKAEARQFLA